MIDPAASINTDSSGASLPIQAVLPRLERATPADAKALYDLELRCFDPGMAFHYRQITSLLHNPRADVWVLRSGPILIGQLIILRRKFRDGIHGRIYSVTVDPSQRGHGYARTLLLHGLDRLQQQGIRHVYLEVEADAEIPLRLYDSLGFSQHHTLVDYYATGRHGIKMRKDLGKPPSGKVKADKPTR